MTAVKSHKQHPILVPVDFSVHSEAALVQAAEIAGCMNRNLVVLHVVHDPGEMPGYYARFAKKKALVRLEDTAADMLGEFIKKVINQHPDHKKLAGVETMLVVGLPVTRILQVADKIKASMVVMGSKGHTGLKHILIGSKAEQVVQLCSKPVLIVKG